MLCYIKRLCVCVCVCVCVFVFCFCGVFVYVLGLLFWVFFGWVGFFVEFFVFFQMVLRPIAPQEINLQRRVLLLKLVAGGVTLTRLAVG